MLGFNSAAEAEITQMSIELEQDILEHALSLPEELGRLSGSIIEELPMGGDFNSVAYASRFIDSELWRGILEIVRQRLGPGIRTEWAISQQQGHDTSKATEGSQEIIKRGIMALAKNISSIEDISLNDTWAQDSGSFTRLTQMLEWTVEEWLAEECGDTLSSRDQRHNEIESLFLSSLEHRDRDGSIGIDASRGGERPSSEASGLENAHLQQQAKPATIRDSSSQPVGLPRRESIGPSPSEAHVSPHAGHGAARIPISSLLDDS